MVLPVDVNHSSWDHQILSSADQQQPPIRLGLRLIKGLSEAAGQRIHTAQRQRAFANVADLRQRACLDRGDMEALAAADALDPRIGPGEVDVFKNTEFLRALVEGLDAM